MSEDELSSLEGKLRAAATKDVGQLDTDPYHAQAEATLDLANAVASGSLLLSKRIVELKEALE